MEKVYCSKCGKECKPDRSCSGYGVMSETGEKVCYACCGEMDEQMLLNARPGERFSFYLTGDIQQGHYVGNWPGSFKIRVYPRKGKHNIARVRYDFWFTFGKNEFHGVRYGNDTEIAHIRCLKQNEKTA